MRSDRWISKLLLSTLLVAISIAGTGAEAEPVSGWAIAGATVSEDCGWLGCRPQPDTEVFEVHAVDGLGGAAIYRNRYLADQGPGRLTVTCMSFSSYDGQDPLSKLGSVFRGSGISEAGQTYHFVVVDTGYLIGYDRFNVSSQMDSGPCGTSSKYLWHTDGGDFRIVDPGDVVP